MLVTYWDENWYCTRNNSVTILCINNRVIGEIQKISGMRVSNTRKIRGWIAMMEGGGVGWSGEFHGCKTIYEKRTPGCKITLPIQIGKLMVVFMDSLFALAGQWFAAGLLFWNTTIIFNRVEAEPLERTWPALVDNFFPMNTTGAELETEDLLADYSTDPFLITYRCVILMKYF